MAQSADGRSLFAVVRTEPWCVVTFGIGPAAGELLELSTDPIAENVCYAATTPSGHLLLASVHAKCLLVHPIRADRSGISAPATQRVDLPSPHCVAFDTETRHAFVPCLAGDVIAQLSFDPARGTLTPNVHAPQVSDTGSGPRHLRVHPNGRFAYLLHEYDGTLHTYRLDAATGTLTRIAQVPTLGQDAPPRARAADVQVHPSGRYLYTTERSSSTITIFSIDSDTSVPHPTGRIETETRPRGIGIDPSGRLLLCAGEASGALRVYAIDPEDGRLSPGGRAELGGSPHWIEFLSH
jgi:6-phosphogluconolactonase